MMFCVSSEAAVRSWPPPIHTERYAGKQTGQQQYMVMSIVYENMNLISN